MRNLCHRGERFGKRAGMPWLMGPPWIHLNEHADGNCQSEDIVQVDVIHTHIQSLMRILFFLF